MGTTVTKAPRYMLPQLGLVGLEIRPTPFLSTDLHVLKWYPEGWLLGTADELMHLGWCSCHPSGSFRERNISKGPPDKNEMVVADPYRCCPLACPASQSNGPSNLLTEALRRRS